MARTEADAKGLDLSRTREETVYRVLAAYLEVLTAIAVGTVLFVSASASIKNTLELTDPVTRWVPAYPEQDTTVGQLLTHQSPSGTYAYDTGRFASLTAVIEECADLPYRHVLAGEIFDRGAKAVSFGSVFVHHPWRPTQFVRRWKKSKA